MKKDLNILLFTLEYPPFKGGVANYYGNLVKYSLVDIEVLTGKKLLRPHWIFSIFHLWQAVKKFKINTVFVGHILPLGTVTYWLSKILKFDYIVFIHGMEIPIILHSKRKTMLVRKILANAKKVIAANSYVAQLLGELVDEDKIRVVNPGVETQNIASPQNIASVPTDQLIKKYNLQNKKVLLQVGRLVKRKGVDKVIEAMTVETQNIASLQKQCPDLVYIVVGRGEMEKDFRLQIEDLGLQNNIKLITDASDEQLETWYELCDFFIMPARNIDGDFEGFGIVYLEANAHGKPVIAGDSGGVRDAVKDGVNGLLVDPESVEEIRDAIIRLYNDEDLCQKLGGQGREWVKNFKWEEQAKKILDF